MERTMIQGEGAKRRGPGRPRKVKLDGDVERGDPALKVVGEDEQSARVHAPLPDKPRHVSARTILADIKFRRQELEPVVEEYQKLLQAAEAIKGI